MKYMSRSLACLVGFFILLGCSNSDDGASDDLAAMQQVEIENFIAENSLDATRDDAGFYYIVEKDSSGGKDQSSGDVLSIYYSMRILGGEEISFFREENGDPLKLRQGVGAVVPIGLDDGLRRMVEGEIYRLILPSELAFGDLEFSTLIPANSIIDIEVELVKIESVADIEQLESDAIEAYIGDNNLNNLTTNPTDSVRVTGSGLRFKRTATVDDGQSPSSGDAVSITFTGKFLNDTQFDATTGMRVLNLPLVQARYYPD